MRGYMPMDDLWQFGPAEVGLSFLQQFPGGIRRRCLPMTEIRTEK
jgi:hypothetical protein